MHQKFKNIGDLIAANALPTQRYTCYDNLMFIFKKYRKKNLCNLINNLKIDNRYSP